MTAGGIRGLLRANKGTAYRSNSAIRAEMKKGKKVALEIIDGGPAEPDWLLLLTSETERSAARMYWLAIIGAMRAADTLTAVNGHMISRLVFAQVVYDRACKAVACDGAVRRVKGVLRRNPQWMIMRQTNELCSELEGQLGLSPRTRHRVGKVARGARRLAADTYLKPVPR